MRPPRSQQELAKIGKAGGGPAAVFMAMNQLRDSLAHRLVEEAATATASVSKIPQGRDPRLDPRFKNSKVQVREAARPGAGTPWVVGWLGG